MVKAPLWVVAIFAVSLQCADIASPHGVGEASNAQHLVPATSLAHFAQIDDGVYKGAEPKTDADFRFLQSLGIRYIVDLKLFPIMPIREKRKAQRYGMTVIPVTINASPFAPSEKHINQALCALKDPQRHPIYFHCDIGRDRTSLVATLYEMYFRGLPPSETWPEMKRFGFKDSWTLHGLKSYLRKHANQAQFNRGTPDCTALRLP